MKKALCVLFLDHYTNKNVEYNFDDPCVWSDMEEDVFGSTALADGGQCLLCFVHSLQLVVRDGMQSVAFARAAIAKVCNSPTSLIQARYITH